MERDKVGINIGDSFKEYTIIEYIGSGNFGQVFQVEHRLLGVTRAMKFLPADSINSAEAALAEIDAMRRFAHPSIMEINDARVFDIGGKPFVAFSMPIAAGGSLDAFCESGSMKFSELILFCAQALSGAQAIHDAGMLHRDIKPGNILIHSNRALLSDFGLTISLNAKNINNIQGYVTHLAPENIAGNAQTTLSDIYAAGVTVFRMVNGYLDFFAVLQANGIDGPDDLERLAKRVPFREWVPDKLKRAIRKAIKPYPDDRYSTAQQFQRRLEALQIDVDWSLSFGDTWYGLDSAGNNHLLEIQGKRKFHVVYTKNDRKVGKYCNSFEDRSDAQQEVWRIVSSTAIV